jgi:methyl-accepting chemotaxis protein
MRTIKNVGVVSKETAREMRELTRPIYEQRRALNAIKATWRVQHATLVETTRVFRQLGHIGRDLIRIFQSYSVAQLRIERAQRDVAEATRDVAYYQDLYNRYVRDFGETSPLAQDALEKLRRAQDDLKRATETVNRAQRDMIGFWISAPLNAVDFIASLAMISANLTALKATLSGATGVLAGFGAVLAPVTVGLGMLATSFVLASKPIEVQNKGLRDLSRAVKDFDEHASGVMKTLGEQSRAFEESRRHAEEYGNAIDEMFKRSPLPDLNVWLQKTHESLKDVTLGFEIGRREIERYGRAIPYIRQVSINQYIGSVSGDYDVSRLANDAYRKFLRRIEDLW